MTKRLKANDYAMWDVICRLENNHVKILSGSDEMI